MSIYFNGKEIGSPKEHGLSHLGKGGVSAWVNGVKVWPGEMAYRFRVVMNDGVDPYSKDGWVITPVGDNTYEYMYRGQLSKLSEVYHNLVGAYVFVDSSSPVYASGVTQVLADPELDLTGISTIEWLCAGMVDLKAFPSNIDTSSVTNMSCAFSNCTSLSSAPDINTSNATDMSGMFERCKALTTIPEYDYSKAKTTSNMFDACTGIVSLEGVSANTVTAVDMSHMFDVCTSLTSAATLSYDSAEDIDCIYQGCSNLSTVPDMSLPVCSSAVSAFSHCKALVNAPRMHFGVPVNAVYLFADCYALESVDLVFDQGCIGTGGMFMNCLKLKSVPLFDTSKSTYMGEMFYRCSALTSIPAYDVSGCTSLGSLENMLYGCTSVTDIGLKGIRTSLDMSKTAITRDGAVKVISNLGKPVSGATLTFSKSVYMSLTSAERKSITDKGFKVTYP